MRKVTITEQDFYEIAEKEFGIFFDKELSKFDVVSNIGLTRLLANFTRHLFEGIFAFSNPLNSSSKGENFNFERKKEECNKNLNKEKKAEENKKNIKEESNKAKQEKLDKMIELILDILKEVTNEN